MLNFAFPLIGVLATLSAFPAPTASLSASVGSEPGLCFGEAPTIVGEPGGSITGTPERDVVITNGVNGTQTGAGDDLVCVTVRPGNVSTGQGNDRIDSSAVGRSEFFIEIVPGSGDDEVIGGPADESVLAARATTEDEDRDVIALAGGRDFVLTGGTFNEDIINLGPGRDSVFLRTRSLEMEGEEPEGLVRGGPGRDRLELLLLQGNAMQASKIDNRTQRLTAHGRLLADWSSFMRFEMFGNASASFIGGKGREVLITRRVLFSHVSMGGGDDLLLLDHVLHASRLNGGDGADRLTTFGATGVVHFDLTAGAYRQTDGRTSTSATAANFEKADVHGGPGPSRITIRGTDGPNLLQGTNGNGGSTIIEGRAGDDVISGHWGDDTLNGGPGHDTANGSSGTDRCDAEVRRDCER